jgi:hypothetical protein
MAENQTLTWREFKDKYPLDHCTCTGMNPCRAHWYIFQAAEEMKEQCARVAESNCESWVAEADGESLTASQSLYGKAEAGREIAAAIRMMS